MGRHSGNVEKKVPRPLSLYEMYIAPHAKSIFRKKLHLAIFSTRDPTDWMHRQDKDS